MRILIAEDNPNVREGLEQMLSDMGHQVFTAVDGHDALKIASQHYPGLAILDLIMPVTNGLQTAIVLGRTQPLPIILLLSDSGEQDLVDQATSLPIHGCLVKPIVPAMRASQRHGYAAC